MAGISGINTGMSFVSSSLEASKTANLQTEMSRFQKMVEAEVVEQGRLNGDYTSTFSGTYNSDADKNALPSGAAEACPRACWWSLPGLRGRTRRRHRGCSCSG